MKSQNSQHGASFHNQSTGTGPQDETYIPDLVTRRMISKIKIIFTDAEVGELKGAVPKVLVSSDKRKPRTSPGQREHRTGLWTFPITPVSILNHGAKTISLLSPSIGTKPINYSQQSAVRQSCFHHEMNMCCWFFFVCGVLFCLGWYVVVCSSNIVEM